MREIIRALILVIIVAFIAYRFIPAHVQCAGFPLAQYTKCVTWDSVTGEDL